jgi:hypothetical protein
VISTPSTPVAESETQRKAHAKRARESRRSTQGISADDVNRAKDQLLMATSDSQSTASTDVSSNGNKMLLTHVIEEVSSPPIFTATLVRPPLPPTSNRPFGNLNETDSNESSLYDQQLNATIRLSPNEFDFEAGALLNTVPSPFLSLTTEPFLFVREQKKT